MTISGERGAHVAAASAAVPVPLARRSSGPVAHHTAPASRLATPRTRRPLWESTYALAVVATDAAMITVAAFAALLVRFGEPSEAAVHGVPYAFVAALIAPAWVTVLAACRAYERKLIGVGSDEFKRVFDASVRLLAVVATASYAFHLELARGFVACALPLGTALLLVGRYAARKVLHRLRADGRASHRVLLVGTREAVVDTLRELAAAPYAGLQVVGACLDDGRSLRVDGRAVPVLGTVADAPRVMHRAGADTVAVAGGWGVGRETLRRLAWDLEGTGADLVVAPALTNVAGPRIHVRPVAGLPLLHVDAPEFTGARRIFKSAFDRLVATLLLVVLSPLLLVVAAGVKLTSPGPVFFRQDRVGRDHDVFRLWKFRTMVADAERQRAVLEALNEHDGVLFKMRRDPRVTPFGRVLRRFSIDELPQLLNVIRGDMSLVGPRPPLPNEVEGYGSDVRRRLLVKPGVTGLWQVSGRSDLSWEETVRLDLYYVENWSVALDSMILWKTASAVLRGRGAY